MPIGEPNQFNRQPDSGSRNTQEKIRLIVNPRAGGGRAGGQIDALKRLTDRAFEQWEITETEAPGHATHLAREAAEQGFDIVAAVGGDGTCHEVVNGLIKDGKAVRKQTSFTVIPFGTGSDLVRSMNIPKRTEEALWIAATGLSLPSDLGMATMTTEEGERSEVFVNVAGFGANGEVAHLTNQSSKRFGGTATFVSATLKTLVSYQTRRVALSIEGPDGTIEWEDELLSAFVANGHYCGSGMLVGSGGSMQDGLFDVSVLKPSSLVQQAVDFRRLYDGTLHKAQGASRTEAHSVTARATDGHPIPIELDGESCGTLPARFEVLPKTLTMRGSWVHQSK
jgi:YegS/Rv2252/BmrU family lipid kinase